jgi:hypothetical protein
MAIYQKINLKPELEKLPLSKLVVFSFVFGLIITLLTLLSQFILPPEIPLFYGMPYGNLQIARSIYILIPPILAVVLTLVNCLIALKIDSHFFKKTLIITAFSLNILSAITVIKIIFLVGSF